MSTCRDAFAGRMYFCQSLNVSMLCGYRYVTYTYVDVLLARTPSGGSGRDGFLLCTCLVFSDVTLVPS